MQPLWQTPQVFYMLDSFDFLRFRVELAREQARFEFEVR